MPSPVRLRLRRYLRGAPAGPPPERVTSDLREWLAEEICQPNPLLQRDGPVCPFTEQSLDRDLLTVHVSPAEYRGPIVAEVLAHAEALAAIPRRALRCRVLAFPWVRKRSVLNKVIDEVRHAVIEHDLVAGLFTPPSTGKKLTKGVASNPDYIPRSPHPCIVLRYLSLHDIDQVAGDHDRLARYQARFGEHFAAGRVRDERIRQAYEAACRNAPD